MIKKKLNGMSKELRKLLFSFFAKKTPKPITNFTFQWKSPALILTLRAGFRSYLIHPECNIPSLIETRLPFLRSRGIRKRNKACHSQILAAFTELTSKWADVCTHTQTVSKAVNFSEKWDGGLKNTSIF